MNAWALLYDELYGDDKMTDDNRVTPQESDEYDPKPESNAVTPQESDEYDPIIGVGTDDKIEIDVSDYATFTLSDLEGVSIGSTASFADASGYYIDPTTYESVTIDTSNYPGVTLDDTVTFAGVGNVAGPLDDSPTPGIEDSSTRKYKEDESIKALQDYISTTYGGHYTSKENNVQTLDLIESVGDAESFCRSNAIKYLSRYDKKGQAKRDILKALHYSLLLYHFSGQLKETTTRGYETF